MQITFNEMKQYFGVIYTPNTYFSLNQVSVSVDEQFDIDRGFLYKSTPNKEEAFSMMRDAIKEKQEEAILKIDDTSERFKAISFKERMAWRIKNNKWDFAPVAKERKENVNKSAQGLLNNIEFNEIDKTKTYKLNAPFMLKENAELYIVVTNVNVLDLGIYVAKAIDLEYTLKEGSNNEKLTIKGNLQVHANNQENLFSFISEENGFRSHHTYHHIFTDKEKALDFYKEEVNIRIENMQKRVAEFEQTVSSEKTAKPSMKM